MKVRLFYGRFLLLGIGFLSLVSAVWAGLLRLGWDLPWLQPALALSHGPLMVCGFLGTLIGLERAVALGRPWAYAAPLMTGLGALPVIVGLPGPFGPLLILLGSLALVGISAVIVRRQTEWFTAVLALGAVAWSIGNGLWLWGIPIAELVHWWIGFPVLTIMGERLELSRLAAPSRLGRSLLGIAITLYLSGLVLASFQKESGLELTGVGMLALAAWLVRFDVARRTVRQAGLPRFIGIGLLSGYLWLAFGGLLLAQAGGLLADPSQLSLRYDAMLHSIFLGFVFSMIFAHAPIIFPAITGRPLSFRPAFYVHLVLLHLSLLARVGGDLAGSFVFNRWSGVLNALALVTFLASSARSMLHVPSEISKAV